MKKVIGFVGSPRNEGNTAVLVRQVLKGAAEAGAETRIYFLNDLAIRGCQACDKCKATGVCAQQDDMTPLYDAIQAADAVVLGTPIYMWEMTAQMKAMIDRLRPLFKPDFSSRLAPGKQAAWVITQGRPEPDAYADYIDMLRGMIGMFGFREVREVLVAPGLRAAGEVAGNAALMAQAAAMGKRLAVLF